MFFTLAKYSGMFKYHSLAAFPLVLCKYFQSGVAVILLFAYWCVGGKAEKLSFGVFFLLWSLLFFPFCWKSGNTSMIKSSSTNPHKYTLCIVPNIFVCWTKSRVMQKVQMFLRAPVSLEKLLKARIYWEISDLLFNLQCFKLGISVETGVCKCHSGELVILLPSKCCFWCSFSCKFK